MKILFIGDIVGKPGRTIVKNLLPTLQEKYNLEFIIANGENAVNGSGITPETAEMLFSYGIDCITTGDHIWKRKEINFYLEKNKNILRPANFPPTTPGKGITVIEKERYKIAVINLQGRVYLDQFHLGCPFKEAILSIEKLKSFTPIIIIDFHAEATSEKVALGWYLDGKVTAVVGTHTHIQTADEIILPQGTAYITDVGMVGPYDSVIGREKNIVIEKFLTQIPQHLNVAENKVKLYGVLISLNPLSGKAERIERLQIEENNLDIVTS